MSEAKHIPGPWEYGGVAEIATTFDKEVNIYPPHHSKTGGYQYAGPIAVVSVSECGEPNAKLIVAAPDLLAALQKALAFIGYGASVPHIVAEAEAAIAKATGK